MWSDVCKSEHELGARSLYEPSEHWLENFEVVHQHLQNKSRAQNNQEQKNFQNE